VYVFHLTFLFHFWVYHEPLSKPDIHFFAKLLGTSPPPPATDGEVFDLAFETHEIFLLDFTKRKIINFRPLCLIASVCLNFSRSTKYFDDVKISTERNISVSTFRRFIFLKFFNEKQNKTHKFSVSCMCDGLKLNELF
jgi:hypothetical protein